jgi:hypothetical protein
VSYFAVQTEFVTLALKHFCRSRRAGSENMPGWLIDANIYFNNVVNHWPRQGMNGSALFGEASRNELNSVRKAPSGGVGSGGSPARRPLITRPTRI